MYRLVYSWDINYFIFDEENWAFLLQKFFLFYKIIYHVWEEIIELFLNETLSSNFNTININNLIVQHENLTNLNTFFSTKLTILVFNQIAQYLEFFFNTDYNNTISNSNILNANLVIYFNFFLSLIFLILLFYFFLLIFFFDYSTVLESARSLFNMLYEEFVLLWVRFSGIKFESYEEAICIIILWPWCIFLIFTHIFSSENNEIFFIFIEWGLPIIYGYLILLESIILFGSYFFIYLNGARGRKLLFVTLIEDIISFIILLARVTLQMVRGIICGLYHDFFRELIEYIIDTWETYWFYATWQVPFLKNYYIIDSLLFFIDWYIIAFTLLFIYIILFLQLLFLLIAVWLFCRCWFISTKVAINKFKLLSLNSTRETNLHKNYKTNLS